MAKYVVVKTHNFDSEVEATEFDNYSEATAYLHWYWEDYYNDEIAEESDLDEDECFHEDEYAKVQWNDGYYTEFNLVVITPKRDGFPYDWERYAAE